MNDSSQPNNLTGFEIAVIGMACRFPGAENIEEFWQNLKQGVESISFFNDKDLKAAGIEPALLENPNYVKAGGILKDIESFDADFFGYNPKEAEVMDPQQRLFLQLAWAAVEDAGYNTDTYDGLIGLFAGAGTNTYVFNLYSNRDISESIGGFETLIGNASDHLCTRTAYKLNLEGPAVAVQTACSTSLVAVHLACQSLISGDCDIALAGGVSLHVPQKTGHLTQEGWIISPDGHCRPFDERAKGTANGSGLGVVVLKRFPDAAAAGDCIHAVIKGSAINNDGAMKIGYTAPRVEGQARVIRAAQLMAEVDADTIGCIETHGTGTELGDPIEIIALTRAFRETTDKRGFCAIGSVKSNFGHLDSGAGVAGLIKAVLCLKHKLLPPSLHYETANPKIDFADSPFYVNNKLSEWPAGGTPHRAGGTPRRAGVSSFGMGGTNAHVILEEAPAKEVPVGSRPCQLLLLSAKTGSALETATDQLIDYLKQHPQVNLPDAAYTLQVGRRPFTQCRAVVCRDVNDAVSTLEERDAKRVLTSAPEQEDRPVVFMFPGQGAQYVNMGLELYRVEPVFREHVDRCFEILETQLELNLGNLLYPAVEEELIKEKSRQLNQTENTQPALFVIEYALARLLMSWGIQPRAMIGHSSGEYVAACLAGVLSLEDALTLITMRGRLMQSLPGGAMLGIPLPEEEVKQKLGAELSLAAVNGAKLCVVSGPTGAVETLRQQLSEEGLNCSRLHTSHAFHSAMMEPAMAPFEDQVKKTALRAPAIPYLSNLTGTWIREEDTRDASYWINHLRQTVRFADNLAELLQNQEWVLLEIGPGRTLSTLAKQHPLKKAHQVILSTLRHPKEPQPDEEFLFNTIGRLWLAGVKIDWPGVYARERRLRLPLPTYPFEGKRYWVELKKRELAAPAGEIAAGKKADMGDWFYQPLWQQTEFPVKQGADETAGQAAFLPGWILFSDECGLGEKIAARLQGDSQDVTIVRKGERFENTGAGSYTINPQSSADYETLVKELSEEIEPPWKIVHLWGVTALDSTRTGKDAFVEFQYSGFYSLLFLTRAIGKQDQDIIEDLHIGIITNNMQNAADEKVLFPGKSTVLGACKVIPKEYPGITCHSIDIILPGPGSEDEKQLVDNLINELANKSADTVIALRHDKRFVQTFAPLRLDLPGAAAAAIEPAEGKVCLREKGTYLLTGGLGGMGLTFSAYLARKVKAKLILVDQLALPGKEEWEQWLANHSEEDVVARKIRAVQALEETGAEVMVTCCEVSDEEQMREVITRAIDRFGDIHGVIHTAGVAGGGMIRLRSQAAVEEVFAPKIMGLYVLDAVFREKKLDFMVLCSSLTSILGEYGQADYCAANIFLDSFAHYATAGYPATHTVSINWDTWKEVGMAVDAAARFGSKEEPQETKTKEVTHPLIEKSYQEVTDRVVYTSSLSTEKHWVLDEHRINGTALLPGTAYIEMVRTAFADYTGDTSVEIGEIFFSAPMLAAEGEIKEVRTVITKRKDGFEFVIESRVEPQEDEGFSWQEHARGQVAQAGTAPAAGYDIKKIEKECSQQTFSTGSGEQQKIEGFKELGPLTFGPRWQHLLKRAAAGEGRALAFLELPETFSGDLQHYYLHPAILDAAASFAAVAKGVYLPFSYKNMKIYRPLPREVYSYIKWQEPESAKQAALHLQVVIMDSRGTVLIEIEDYTLRNTHDMGLKPGEINQKFFGPHMRGETFSRSAAISRNSIGVTLNGSPRRGAGRRRQNTEENYRLGIGSPGILDTLALRPCARRKPGPGEVEISVDAVGLNFKDVLMALTVQPGDLAEEVTRFGSECVGRITAVGEGVEGFKAGDRVIAAAPDCFSTYLTTSASFVVPKLSQLSSEEAAAIPIAFMTASYALFHLGGLRKGERVLIHAAAGGVGQAAVQLAQQAGAEIFATAGSPEKREFLRSLGIPYIMNSRTLDFADEIMEYTAGAGVDVVLNSLAGDFMVKSLETLAPFGRFLEIGKRDIYQAGQMNLKPFQKGLAFFSVNLSPRLPAYRSILLEVVQGFKEGNLKPLPYKVFPVTEVEQAFDFMARAKHIGKLVISMQDSEAAVLAASARAAKQPAQRVRLDVPPVKAKAPGSALINLQDGITAKEGVEVLERILGSSLSQVVVSTRDLDLRLEEQKSGGTAQLLAGMEQPDSPAEQHARPALAAEYVAPRDETENIFAAIWQEVLGIDRVGIYDNFFDLGGASLQSIQVVAKAKEAGIEIAPELLFEFQTIAEIVTELSNKTS